MLGREDEGKILAYFVKEIVLDRKAYYDNGRNWEYQYDRRKKSWMNESCGSKLCLRIFEFPHLGLYLLHS